jgi:hypothetical protein
MLQRICPNRPHHRKARRCRRRLSHIHVLDDAHGNVQKLWKSLGAPNKPSPAQLATLKAASEAGVVPVPASALVKLNATATTVSLTITENSAVVVEYIV